MRARRRQPGRTRASRPRVPPRAGAQWTTVRTRPRARSRPSASGCHARCYVGCLLESPPVRPLLRSRGQGEVQPTCCALSRGGRLGGGLATLPLMVGAVVLGGRRRCTWPDERQTPLLAELVLGMGLVGSSGPVGCWERRAGGPEPRVRRFRQGSRAGGEAGRGGRVLLSGNVRSRDTSAAGRDHP